eukprot:3102848-Rhodomonas_salina.2
MGCPVLMHGMSYAICCYGMRGTEAVGVGVGVGVRRNVFLTGSAGTGKSFVLRHMIRALRSTLSLFRLDGSRWLNGSLSLSLWLIGWLAVSLSLCLSVSLSLCRLSQSFSLALQTSTHTAENCRQKHGKGVHVTASTGAAAGLPPLMPVLLPFLVTVLLFLVIMLLFTEISLPYVVMLLLFMLELLPFGSNAAILGCDAEMQWSADTCTCSAANALVLTRWFWHCHRQC